MNASNARRAFRVPPLVVVALLGFSSGLPLYLTGSTLKAWLTTQGLNLKTIGLFGLIVQPYALKFLWAPVLDRFVLPFLGRRRGWMLVFQGMLALTLARMATCDPRVSVARIVVLGFLVAFASASQDTVIDAWRAESFDEHSLGMANAVNNGAYQVAMLTSGALALVSADRVGWRFTYMFMAALMVIGALGTFLAESSDRVRPPRTLREAAVAPLKEFFLRPGIVEILAFCLLYKIGDQLADAMTMPFLIRGMGFSLSQISITKVAGIACIVLGGLAGGLFMRKLDMWRALLIFGFCQVGSILAFWALSRLGPHLWALVGALSLENLSYGMGGTAFATFLMRLCDKRFTATQYALLTSFFAFTRGYLSAPTGWLVLRLGWSGYFLFCAAAAIPGLLLLRRFKHWKMPEAA